MMKMFPDCYVFSYLYLDSLLKDVIFNWLLNNSSVVCGTKVA